MGLCPLKIPDRFPVNLNTFTLYNIVLGYVLKPDDCQFPLHVLKKFKTFLSRTSFEKNRNEMWQSMDGKFNVPASYAIRLRCQQNRQKPV